MKGFSVREIGLRSWWIFFCLFTCLISYRAHQLRNVDIREMEFRLSELEKAKCMALSMQEEMQMQISSQNDPAWVEMVLMRELGVVPEGWLKIHFQ